MPNNIGAFGENFPYTNQHDMNQDWIIKIAKDFLDQYTGLQETITNGINTLDSTIATGLEELQDKYTELDGLLNQWYETHSEDIAEELASALSDLNDWYTTHVGYLDQAVVDNLTNFNTRAEAKMEEVLADIPADYTNLANIVQTIRQYYDSMDRIPVIPEWEQGSFNSSTGVNTESSTRIRTDFIETTRFHDMIVEVDTGYLYELDRYDSNYTLLETISWNNTPRHINLENTKYLRLILCKSGNTEIIPSEGIHLSLSGFTPLYIWSQEVNSEFIHFGGYVTTATMATTISDANNAVSNNYYIIRFTEDEENILANLPFEQTREGYTDVLTLICYGSATYKMQKLIDRRGDIWVRIGLVQGNYWFRWFKNSGDETSGMGAVIEVGSTYEYTKLTDAMKYAFENANTTVIVHEGTYNIIEEMGASYWENFTDYSDLTHAMIGNGAHFIFSPDSRVECNYNGNNQNVRTLYSPFNSLYGAEGDFIIENMVLRVSGCRYAIHDDVGASIVQQTHKYINCDIANENRCIGAGLGANMVAEMRDCVFRSTGNAGNNPVSWHNSGGRDRTWAPCIGSVVLVVKNLPANAGD